MKPLDPALLSIKDADSQSESMLLQLLQPPSNGHLVVLEKDRDRALGRDDIFTFIQLKHRAVRFIHHKEQTKWVGVCNMEWSFPQDIYIMLKSHLNIILKLCS